MKAAFPRMSYIFLCNPFLYATEGLRVAVLGQATSVLPFWISMVALWCSAGVLGVWGIARLRKKLDFV